MEFSKQNHRFTNKRGLMSLIEYDATKNSVLVCSGYPTKKGDLKVKQKNDHFSELHRFSEFAGIEVQSFLSSKEQLALIGEETFTNFLTMQKIPHLYVGQGPFGVERSSILIDETRSKRPDFIVHIPAVGAFLFDVKCRQRITLTAEKQTYFYLFTSEIIALQKLQSVIHLPVWIAFIDREKLEEPQFFIAPIMAIDHYFKNLKGELRKQQNNKNTDARKVKAVRIPQQILTRLTSNVVIPHIQNPLNGLEVAEFAKAYIDLFQHIEQKILDFIQTKKPTTTELNTWMKNNLTTSLFYTELQHLLTEMFRNGAIILHKDGTHMLRK